jgi:ABC-2 type transport system permease protein
MKKTWLVLRYELGSVLRTRSFLLTTFGLPLLAALVFLVVPLIKGDGGGDAGGPGSPAPSQDLRTEGYVDTGGLIQVVPADLPEGVLVAYPDDASAYEALVLGEIAAYYVIPADYVETGDLIYVNPSYNLTSSWGQSWVMRQAILANLLENDPARIALAHRPMDLEVTALGPDTVQRDDDNPLSFLIPYGTMMIFYVVILMSASLLLNSVTKEKQNRVMEVLLLSAHPGQFLAGKIAGLGMPGLLQTATWVGTGYALLRLSGRRISLPPGIALPPSVLGWGLVLFILGYLVYASLMASLGALAPSAKEATQSVIVVIWPLLIPLFCIAALIKQPHGALAMSLSLFPLTSPVAMVTRLVTGEVPWWQPLLAAGLLGATAVLVIRAVARMFRAQTLLSGEPASIGRYVGALLGKV